MSDSLTRRQLLKTSVGGLGVLTFSSRATAQSNRQLTRYEADLLRRHANIRIGIYTRFADRFQLTDEMLLEQFRDSLPLGGPQNLSDVKLRDLFLFTTDLVTKGIVGDALTLKWYEDTRARSQIARTYDQGMIIDGPASARGGNKSASSDAAEENQKLAESALNVATAADTYYSSPSTANRQRVLNAITDEYNALRSHTDTIQDWSSIDPDDYQLAGEGPKTVKQVAISNVAAISGFQEILQGHKTAITSGGSQLLLPQFLENYETNIELVRDQIPEAIRGLVFGDQVNLYFMHQPGSSDREDVEFAVYVSTGSDGEIEEYALLPRDDTDANIYTTEQKFREIVTSSDPGKAAQTALEEDTLRISGQGLSNDIKYGASEWFAESGQDLIDGVSDTADDISDSISGWL